MTTSGDGDLNCIGICNSNAVNTTRFPDVHITPVTQMHFPEARMKIGRFVLHPIKHRAEPTEKPIRTNKPVVKKMHTRRNEIRKTSHATEEHDIIIIDSRDESDDKENHCRSQITKYFFGICGTMLVILGIGVLLYAVILGILSFANSRNR